MRCYKQRRKRLASPLIVGKSAMDLNSVTVFPLRLIFVFWRSSVQKRRDKFLLIKRTDDNYSNLIRDG